MQGVQSNSYSIPVEVDGGLREQTGGSELSHSGRTVAVVCPSSLGSEVPPPPYSELFPDPLPSYWEATGERRVFERCTSIQLANIYAAMRSEPDIDPPEPAHRRVECLRDAFCGCSLERLIRMMLIPTMCLLVCVLIVILLEIYTSSDP